MAAPALASIAIQETFRRLYYGAWLPNTYALKLGGVPLGTRVARGVDVVTYAVLGSLGVAIVLVAWAWQSLPRSRRELGLLLGLAASAGAYTIYVGGDAWEWMRYADRYLTPAVVLLLIAAAIGVSAAAAAAPPAAAIRTGIVVVLVMTAISASSLAPGGRQLFDIDASAVDPTMVILGATLFVVVALALQRDLRQIAIARHAALAMTIAVAAAVSGPALAYWVEANAAYAGFDASHARAGEFLRATTPPDASIAVTAAGATIYFAHREGVDVLGKMDPQIAQTPIHQGWFFWPGHMKWDYSITLRERPALIVSPWIAQPSDLREIADAGYTYWVVRRSARARFGLSSDDDGGLFVAPGVNWLDRAIFAPAPFPQFARTMPLLPR
jgi:hypothetical protein